MTLENLQLPIKPTEVWDSARRQLTCERRETLTDSITEIFASSNTASIIFEPLTEGESPSVTMRLVIDAKDEAAAKKASAEQFKFSCSKTNTKLEVEDLYEGSGVNNVTITSGRGVTSISSISIGGGVVRFNGQVINGNMDTQNITKEIVVKIKPEQAQTYNLRSISGDISLPSGQGELKAKTTSGDISIGDFTGKIKAKTTSGDTRIDRLNGVLEGNSTSGNLRAKYLTGSVEFDGTSSGITIRDFVCEQESTIKTTSGDIEVALSNQDISISAKTMSGRLKPSSQFRSQDTNPKNKKYFYGDQQKAANSPKLELSTLSGDVEISHTQREIEAVHAKPRQTESNIFFAECHFCRSAYPTDSVKVNQGVIVEIKNPKCSCCGASRPRPARLD